MIYHLDFSKQAISDINSLKKSGNKALLKKLLVLLDELAVHPFEGTGKPEQLKYDFAGFWSRRISHELGSSIKCATIPFKFIRRLVIIEGRKDGSILLRRLSHLMQLH
jgi:toxin YoeB